MSTQGSFNKLYEVFLPSKETQYLFRVSLPVDPFYKTESEVATIAYLRQHTTITVPSVIAWSSSADNIMGYEWVLFEKINGVPLSNVWSLSNVWRTIP